jgi:hypothetical protein
MIYRLLTNRKDVVVKEFMRMNGNSPRVGTGRRSPNAGNRTANRTDADDEIDKLIESDQAVIPAHEVSCIALATNTQTHTLALLSVLYHDHHGET